MKDRSITKSVRVNIARGAKKEKRLSHRGGEVSLRGGEVSNDCPDDRSITNSVKVNIARGDKKEKGGADKEGDVFDDCPDDRYGLIILLFVSLILV